MKRKILSILLLLAAMPAAAQLLHPGEVLEYRISYKAKLFPNTEVGTVTISTTQEEYKGRDTYKINAHGRTMPTYRWFFDLDDRYTIHTDKQTLRPVHFEANIKESDYTFWSKYEYDWKNKVASTRWQSRKNAVQTMQLPLTEDSMDPISLFFRMRSANPDNFRPGEVQALKMVLEDTIRTIKFRFIGRELKKIPNMGRYKTLHFTCQLGSSESYSFTDNMEFSIWISDDKNKIPLYLESPIRIGSVQAYISGYRGLKYPVESRVK